MAAFGESKRGDLRRLAPRLWFESTDGDGRLDKEAVVQALSSYLDDNPSMAEHERLARQYVDEVDKETRPASEGRQSELFDRDRYIPTGPRERVRMGSARRVDVVRWGSIDDAEQAASNAAWAKKSGYRNSRLIVWTDEYETLDELERALFGAVDDGDEAE